METMQKVVRETAERGWSEEVEENEAGIACVGVALTRPGARSVAVSVTGPIERMDAAHREEVGQVLREEVARLAPAGFAPARRG